MSRASHFLHSVFNQIEAHPGATATALVSLGGLFIAYSAYRRKSGLRFRGTYGTTSSVTCEDDFISSVTIENLKDRAVTIFGIYLRIGYNVYVVVEDFSDTPLILRPFETYQKEYEPIDFYTFNMKRLSIDDLLKDRSVAKRLMVSTSDGRYVVRKLMRRWDPVHKWFRNHLTFVVQPIRSEFKGKSYGSNVVFFVELNLGEGKEQVIPIYESDYRIRRFRRFKLTREALQSTEALEALLKQARDEGHLLAESVTVHDARASRSELFGSYSKEKLTLPSVGAFRYYVLGRIGTKLSEWHIRLENKRRAKTPKGGAAEEKQG